MKNLFMLLSIILLLAGCGDGYTHVGANGVDATPRNLVLGPSIHLAPGTKLAARREVSENAWEYELKEGPYAGNYVVIQNRDVE
jgi:hypothetical protein